MKKYIRFLKIFLIFSSIVIYGLLAWLQIVPSVVHIPFVRKLWDEEFLQCQNHQHEQSLSKQPGNLYFTFSLHGRLGNWMFAYASLLGIAKMNKNKIIPYVPENHGLTYLFKIGNKLSSNPVCVDKFTERLPCAYDQRMENLPESNLTLYAYLQSWRYFREVQEEVRKEFTFHNDIQEQARRIFLIHTGQKTNPDLNLTTVCVHVRRTDMMIPSSTKLGFKSAPLTYITNAMKYMREKFKHEKLKFVVISDDFQWSSEFLGKTSDVTIIPRNDNYVDLALLTLCNHSIITTGTFGWWGAWLAGGHTVYYKNYPEPGSKIDRGTVKEDYYPPTWVAIDTASFVNQLSARVCFGCVTFVFCIVKFIL